MAYAVGIDLGTTHCSIAAVDPDLSEGEEIALSVVPVPQSIAPAQVEARPLLPSFVYLPHEGELPKGALALPWSAESPGAIGELARSLGQKTPLRLVSSAKSWLCHSGVDRRAAILPAGAEGDASLPRISPVEASARYLAHLREAWDAASAEAPLAEQPLVITVPASFDPVARELTVEAAKSAGLAHAVLLEEPQAALYAWIARSGGRWRDDVKVGDVILVIDVGGGTTDLSAIAVTEEAGALALTRVAVGEHILLGGDNMDLALAHHVRQRIEGTGTTLDASQVAALVPACRRAKEVLLAEGAPESVPVTIVGKGSKLVGGSIRSELTRAEVASIVVDGFAPATSIDASPERRARGAITQLGLPYASDAAITRHLAAFLRKQKDATSDLSSPTGGGSFLRPTAILFNGGVLKATALRQRLTDTLGSWLAADGAPPARVLEGADLDLAVARGAAYFAHVRGGRGVRIHGGTAKSFYVGVESAMPAVPGLEPPVTALCVAPFGMEEGTSAPAAPQELGLVVGEPVRFRFFSSSTRRDDHPGTLVERWEGHMEELRAIEATLPAEGRREGDVVPVRLEASVSDVGVLELAAVAKDGARWKVALETR